jgi:hypothetical protein
LFIWFQQIRCSCHFSGIEQAPVLAKTDATRSSLRVERDFGKESLMLKNSKILGEDERKSIHEGNINILNSKTEEQILKDRVNLSFIKFF